MGFLEFILYILYVVMFKYITFLNMKNLYFLSCIIENTDFYEKIHYRIIINVSEILLLILLGRVIYYLVRIFVLCL
jgi:hypothetical protein